MASTTITTTDDAMARHDADGATTARRHDDGPRMTTGTDDGHGHGGGDGIEWEDDMVAVNRLTTSANTRWMLIDRATGAANAAIDWRFTVGDRVKIRLVNEMDSDHPMHHPFHLHGAGRFLVLARDGVTEPNLVWKDTVLVRTGQPSTSCSTSPIPACGWRTATSPSTCTAA